MLVIVLLLLILLLGHFFVVILPMLPLTVDYLKLLTYLVNQVAILSHVHPLMSHSWRLSRLKVVVIQRLDMVATHFRTRPLLLLFAVAD